MVTTKKQVWIDSALARKCKILAAENGKTISKVVESFIEAGLFLSEKTSNERATTKRGE
jgi:hypothetical protein